MVLLSQRMCPSTNGPGAVEPNQSIDDDASTANPLSFGSQRVFDQRRGNGPTWLDDRAAVDKPDSAPCISPTPRQKERIHPSAPNIR